MKELFFKTKELNFFEKFLQMYWMNPDSWLLDEFKLSGDSLTIVRKDGHIFYSKLHDTQSTYLMDKYDRREAKISNKEGGKTRFKEIPGMLLEEEWDLIFKILDAKENKVSEILSNLNAALEKFNNT